MSSDTRPFYHFWYKCGCTEVTHHAFILDSDVLFHSVSAPEEDVIKEIAAFGSQPIPLHGSCGKYLTTVIPLIIGFSILSDPFPLQF